MVWLRLADCSWLLWLRWPRRRKTEPAPAPAPQTPGVVSTGGAHAAVLDSEKRPITAGGFVDSGPVVFQDYSEKSGLTRWRHTMGTPEDTFIGHDQTGGHCAGQAADYAQPLAEDLVAGILLGGELLPCR